MAMDYFVSGKPPGPWGLDHIHRVPARAFIASDGRWVQVAATSDLMYSKFCGVLGLIDDPRFRTNNDRVQHRSEIMPFFEEKMKEKTSEEWLYLLEEAGIPCGPILNFGEVFDSPNIKAREMMFTMPPPVENEIPQLGFPYKFSDTSPSAKLRPPLLGEHAEMILSQKLGMDQEEIDELIDEKVVIVPLTNPTDE